MQIFYLLIFHGDNGALNRLGTDVLANVNLAKRERKKGSFFRCIFMMAVK